ncbi:MAG: MotA/TolQ/ExbB proton channel family protein [Cyanobacteria bacterium]|nr:MotA/TolQ/ExbB proton channel family protein [Cyanobacteriota bacterium]
MGGLQAVGGEGPISLLLLLLSIAVVTVSFDRARYWLQWWRQRRLRQNRWEQTAAAGADAIESQLLEWNSQMAFGEPLLQAAGVIGPLLGLIGTVIGLMRVLASLGPQLVLPAGANLTNYGQVLLSTALGLTISLIATSSLFANQGIRHWQGEVLRRRLRLRAQPTQP